MKNKETTMDSATRNGVSAIVEYEYTAKEGDELTLVKGAIIHSIKMQPGGWWEGTLTSGKTGMFPDNFVRVLEPDDRNPVVLRDKTETKNRRCKAVYSYTQNNNDELTLAVGDIIEFLGEVEEGWWRGKLAGKIGVFPSNFVVAFNSSSPVLANRRSTTTCNNVSRIRNSLSSSREDLVSSTNEKDAPSLPPKPVREMCKVLFPYEASNDDELDLKEGDIIAVLSKELPDKGWWKGELKGKIGVFPDNFVQIISPEGTPTKEYTNSLQRPDRPPSTTKLLINNNNNNNNKSASNNRKNSFGSKDSLNDSGIITGNVAAYRKSLESKSLEVTASERINRKSIETKITSEIRKSLESLDERKSTPPPVLTKKPVVPIKKSPTVGSVAGNLISGFKGKAKSVEQKLGQNDSLDGVGSSKIISQIPDNGEKGVIVEKMKKDDTEFDQVERSSILQDMRAGRAKAPKRRPPSSSTNTSGESLTYQNGNSNHDDSAAVTTSPAVPTSPLPPDGHKSDEDVTRPLKQREWEKHKAPWMEELKASQAKKTSPGVEIRSPDTTTAAKSHSVDEGGDKTTFGISFASHKKINENSFESRSSSVDTKSTVLESLHGTKKDGSGDNNGTMAKSMSSLSTKISILSDASSVVDENAGGVVSSGAGGIGGLKPRPNSVTLRNRSISPIGFTTKTIIESSSNGSTSISTSTATITKSSTVNNNDASQTSSISASSVSLSSAVTSENVCSRVAELELRVQKLEKLVQKQNATIEDLQRSLKDESDKVKTLKTELDKYAQCVTQV